jgi:Caenorhabditis protein of unknown function, DUF268
MDYRSSLKSLGYRLIRLSESSMPADRLDLSGDRDVEWAWVAGNLPENPGRVLDFGPATSYSGLIAAFRGGTVVGLDLEAPPTSYVHRALSVVCGDILAHDFGGERFDTVINCSTVEHVGLPGRYGSPDIPDGDLQAMRRLRSVMSGHQSRMVLTIPVGRDGIFAPAHRVYGERRLPALLEGYRILREVYFAKYPGDNRWKEATRDAALAIEGSASFYALGLFVVAPD